MKISKLFPLLLIITVFNTDSIKIIGNISPFYLFLLFYLIYQILFERFYAIKYDTYINIIFISNIALIIVILISDIKIKNNNISNSIANIYPLIGTIILFILLYNKNKEAINYYIYTKLFYLACQMHALYGLIQAIQFVFFGKVGNIRGSINSFRISGFFPDSNIYSFSVLMALSYLLAKNNKKLGIYKIILRYIFIIINTFVIFLTGSRTAIISIFIITIYNIYLRIRKKNRVIFLLIIIIIISININNILDMINYTTRVILQRNLDLKSDIRINYLWKTAIEIFIKNPIIGAGTDSVMRETGTMAHNMILGLLSDRGIVGTIIYLFPMIPLYIKAKNGRKENILMVFAFLIASMGISNWNLRIPEMLLLFNIWEMRNGHIQEYEK